MVRALGGEHSDTPPFHTDNISNNIPLKVELIVHKRIHIKYSCENEKRVKLSILSGSLQSPTSTHLNYTKLISFDRGVLDDSPKC